MNVVDFALIIKKSADQRNEEDIKKIVEMTMEYNFAAQYTSEKFYEICKNAELKIFGAEDTIFEIVNEEMQSKTVSDFIILSGTANLYKTEGNVMTFLKILSEEDEFGNFEANQMFKNDNTIKKLILISNKETEICAFKESETEIKLKPIIPVTEKTYVTFDPEIFLIDNPKKIYETIDGVKDKIDKEFKIFQKYSEIVEKFCKEKEVSEIFNEINEHTETIEISNIVENKMRNYTDEAKLEVKLGLILKKSLLQIGKCNKDIKEELEDFKVKLFSSTNLKNKNLMNMSIEEEIRKEEFKRYMIEKINKEGKLSNLIEEKRKNEEIINTNKQKIKKEETYLLDTFYCVKCHIRPRNAISKNCHHLMSCDECILKTKVCPRCGIDIDKFDKIYRS